MIGRTPAGILVALLLVPAARAQTDVVRFDWGLGALTGPDRTFTSIGRAATLTSGDQLKMFLRLKQSGFVYVIFYGTDHRLTLLYPTTLQSSPQAVDVPVYMPRGAAWMHLDDLAGTETIYLIASSKRLDHLEDALKEYIGAATPGPADMAKRVLDEIARLKDRFRPIESAAERPVDIAGRVRGLQTDVATFATEVSARGFYSRTITIDHR